MANRLCWNCDVKAHMTLATASVKSAGEVPGITYMGGFTCDECGYMSLGFAPSQSVVSMTPTGLKWLEDSVETWYPVHGAGREFPDVPSHIASAASEAVRCHSIRAFRACTLLCRSVIEATAKEKNVTKGMLMTKIDEMEKQGLIRPHIKDAAHEIRYFGNSMAHGDFVVAVTEEESDEILELMGEVLNEVFQSPKKIERRKLARQAKTAP